MIRNKTIKFDMDKPEDKELWEYLAKLPHGEFTETVKDFFREQMYDQSTFTETSKSNIGPAISYNDPKVQEAFKSAAKDIKTFMEEPLPKDHPFRKLYK